ncbi:signal peptidase I [Solicola sp. PLA-1-18]|uniref:signal peptidase I n=1 Tax=Solicola sp. PLA-1-18 TaxID=3380532 RepID=UPI003B7BBF43
MNARSAKRSSLWREIVIVVATALVLSVVVKTFFVESFYVPSASMEPTLRGDDVTQDRFLVQKWSYWTGEPKRGDIVVFKDPGGWLAESGVAQNPGPVQRALSVVGLYPAGDHLVKRVVGVGGDTIRCCNAQGRLLVNGTAVEEPYVMKPDATGDQRFETTVPKGSLWVMGDNRGDSADSRFHTDDPGRGFVPVDDVVGKGWVVVWPWRDRGSLGGTTAFDAVRPAS